MTPSDALEPTNSMSNELTRPIVGIEHRTAQEVFDIMCDRFRFSSRSTPTGEVDNEVLKLLRDHHNWHLQSGSIGLQDGQGGWVEIDNAAEYCDSRLYDRTAKALADLPPEMVPTPRGGWTRGSNYWEDWQLAMRRLKKAEAEIAALHLSAKEPEGPASVLQAIRDKADAVIAGHDPGEPAPEGQEAFTRTVAMAKDAVRALVEISALASGHAKESEGWRDIATSPKDGTCIQAKIPGHGSDNIIAWSNDPCLSG